MLLTPDFAVKVTIVGERATNHKHITQVVDYLAGVDAPDIGK